MIHYSLLKIVPADESHREFSYQVKKAALGGYITELWGWDETSQREFHTQDWSNKRPSIILYDNQPIGTIYFVENAVGLTIPFASTFIILSMASFGVMIPSAPGFIGTFHLSVQYGLMFYGVGKEEALSAAIVWHAALFFPTVVVGFIFFLYEQTVPRRNPEIISESTNRSLDNQTL